MSDAGWYDHTLPRRELDREHEEHNWQRILAAQKRARERRDQGAQAADRGKATSDESSGGSRRG